MGKPDIRQIRDQIEEIRKKAEAIQIAAKPDDLGPAAARDRLLWVRTEVNRLLKHLDELAELLPKAP